MTSPYAKRQERRRRIGVSRNRGSTPRTNPATKMSVPTGQNFASCYMELCKQQRIRPLSVICVTLPQCLDFTTDRVKMDDWGPILNSLTLDRSLRSISVRNRYQCRKPLEEINSEDKARTMGKAPVVLSRYLLEWLSHSVAQCVRNSPALTCLELEGIPLPSDCLATLCVGLASTQTLQHLSLQRCYIGDDSCELVCRTVADVQSIRTLNLSQCDLSSNCGASLAAALSRQKLSLYHDTWKQSLRYREPNLEAMPGLRRLTLNGNPHLGDVAVAELIEAIRDSLWLKAVDLQHCGLTNDIGKAIIELLDSNKTLSVIDVRVNPNLEDDFMDEIFRRLEINNAENGRSDYRWLSLPQRDNRNVVSAGERRRNRYEETNNEITTRPKSAFVAKTRRPFVSASAGKIFPSNPNAVGRRARFDTANRSSTISKAAGVGEERKDGAKDGTVDDSARKGRVSLHVDLRAQMDPMIPESCENPEEPDEDAVAPGVPEEESPSKPSIQDSGSVEELSRVLQQLSEARMEHDRLMDETRRTEMLLAEERSRRENAETKLEVMKRDLTDLEVALREKESETRGFLLISQRSLDDVAESFDRVLDMLDHVAGSSTANGTCLAAERQDEEDEDSKNATQDYSMARAEMRRRVARLIRKTKSESHGRGLLRVECDETSVIQASMDVGNSSTKKFVKSEGDMRNSLPPIVQPIRLERNIGDSPDVVSALARRLNHAGHSDSHEMADRNKMASPCARARALFAQIVNGEPFIHLGAHGS